MELPPPLDPFVSILDTDPCWCKSGRSFADCHKERVGQPKAHPHQAMGLLAKQFRRKIGCLHPDAPDGCQGKVISSHTIQKSGPLKAIAENGEVYSMRDAINRIVENNGRLIPQRRGISQVSTFPGFCERHDSKFFEPIESGSFAVNLESAFLAHYRNICSEYHAKLSMQYGQNVREMVDGGKDKIEQLLAQQFMADLSYGASLAEKELNAERTALIENWRGSSFHALSCFFVEYEAPLPFVASFVSTPKFTFGGDFVQDWGDEKLSNVSVTSVNQLGCSGFLFSSTHTQLIKKLADELECRGTRGPSDILRWTIANAENVALRITWWDHLSDRRKKHLLDLAMIGVLPAEASDERAAYLAGVEVLPPVPVARMIAL